MRILHLGDIHIHGGPNFDDAERALEQVTAITRHRNVDLVLIPGDIFDQKSTPPERDLFGRFLRSLCCPVIACKGNHDALGDLLVYGGYQGVQVYEQPALVSCGEVDVLVLPWPERAHLAAAGFTGEGGLQAAQAALGDLIRGMAADRDTSRPLVIMGHLSVVGALSSSGQPLVGREIQVVAQDLLDTEPAYVGLSHIHLPQDINPRMTYAGSLTVQNFGEEGEEKRVMLVTVNGRVSTDFESIPIPGRRWITVEAHVQDGSVVVYGCPVEGKMVEGNNIRFRYTCTEEESHLFNHAEIEARFSSANSLKIEPKIVRSARVRSAEVAEAKTTADKLAAWGLATGTEIAPGIVHKLESLEEGRP